jgi:hypothetical protein
MTGKPLQTKDGSTTAPLDEAADEDAERDRRGEGLHQERPVDGDARVRERKERHDDIARPGMEPLLQPLVDRRRRAELESGDAREVRGRLLTELAKTLRPRSRFERGAGKA